MVRSTRATTAKGSKANQPKAKTSLVGNDNHKENACHCHSAVTTTTMMTTTTEAATTTTKKGRYTMNSLASKFDAEHPPRFFSISRTIKSDKESKNSTLTTIGVSNEIDNVETKTIVGCDNSDNNNKEEEQKQPPPLAVALPSPLFAQNDDNCNSYYNSYNNEKSSGKILRYPAQPSIISPVPRLKIHDNAANVMLNTPMSQITTAPSSSTRRNPAPTSPVVLAKIQIDRTDGNVKNKERQTRPLSVVKIVTNETTLRFPEALDTIICEAEACGSQAFYWNHGGQAFGIGADDKEMRVLLQTHFSHSNFSSLQRQLNIYGFKKYVKGRFKGSYHHPNFHRDKTESFHLDTIQRNVSPKPDSLAPLRAQGSGRPQRRLSANPTIPYKFKEKSVVVPKKTRQKGRRICMKGIGATTRGRTCDVPNRIVAKNETPKSGRGKATVRFDSASMVSSTAKSKCVSTKKRTVTPALLSSPEIVAHGDIQLQRAAQSIYNGETLESMGTPFFQPEEDNTILQDFSSLSSMTGLHCNSYWKLVALQEHVVHNTCSPNDYNDCNAGLLDGWDGALDSDDFEQEKKCYSLRLADATPVKVQRLNPTASLVHRRPSAEDFAELLTSYDQEICKEEETLSSKSHNLSPSLKHKDEYAKQLEEAKQELAACSTVKVTTTIFGSGGNQDEKNVNDIMSPIDLSVVTPSGYFSGESFFTSAPPVEEIPFKCHQGFPIIYKSPVETTAVRQREQLLLRPGGQQTVPDPLPLPASSQLSPLTDHLFSVHVQQEQLIPLVISKQRGVHLLSPPPPPVRAHSLEALFTAALEPTPLRTMKIRSSSPKKCSGDEVAFLANFHGIL